MVAPTFTPSIFANWEETTESNDLESTQDQIVPPEQCRECANRPIDRGLCIACFLE